MTATETQSVNAAPVVAAAKYNYALGYLRAIIVVLVVAHHAMLAYHPFAPPPPASLMAQPRWWQAFPVVDTQKWSGASLLVGFNDVFFMSLMFFLSGLFVWHGLARKGSATFLRDRLLRLGLPFIISVAIFAPLAYYPTYLQTPDHTGMAGFWHQWLPLGQWPAGPAWFVWVLLVFDCVAALLFLAWPTWGAVLGRMTAGASRSPAVFFAALVAVSAILYIPMALIFNSISWTALGPFTFQTSRILHYLAYFLIAVGVGAWGVDRGLLAPDGRLARRWAFWVIASLILFAASTGLAIVALVSHTQSTVWAVAVHSTFVLSCAATSFAFLASFLRFARSRSRLLDSLGSNSYPIYLVHYVFVSWLQFALLPATLPAIAKVAIVFFGALGLSWGTAATVRRIPGVTRVI
jgi:peptidoglycan/LPS O-acetylase OafA/YrhL